MTDADYRHCPCCNAKVVVELDWGAPYEQQGDIVICTGCGKSLVIEVDEQVAEDYSDSWWIIWLEERKL